MSQGVRAVFDDVLVRNLASKLGAVVHVERVACHEEENGEFPNIHRKQVIVANGAILMPGAKPQMWLFDATIATTYSHLRELHATHCVAVTEARGLVTRCEAGTVPYYGVHPSAVEHAIDDQKMTDIFVDVISGYEFDMRYTPVAFVAEVLRQLLRG